VCAPLAKFNASDLPAYWVFLGTLLVIRMCLGSNFARAPFLCGSKLYFIDKFSQWWPWRDSITLVNSLIFMSFVAFACEPNRPGQKINWKPLAREGWVSIICHQPHPYNSTLMPFTMCTEGEYCGGCVCTLKFNPQLTYQLEWSQAHFWVWILPGTRQSL
jgi:hypothetical protein